MNRVVRQDGGMIVRWSGLVAAGSAGYLPPQKRTAGERFPRSPAICI